MHKTATAKFLVPILAVDLAVPEATALVIDRLVAAAGLRKRGKGRTWPDMTRREALIFLLACMSSLKPMQAAAGVRKWMAATTSAELPEILASCPDEWWSEADYESRQQLAQRVLASLPRPPDPSQRIQLIDYLMALCDMLEAGAIPPDAISIEINFSKGRAKVTLDLDDQPDLVQRFLPDDDGHRHELPASALHTLTMVNGHALVSIIKWTAPPSPAEEGEERT